MNSFDKLMKALTLRSELEKLQDEFKKTLDQPSSDSKLKKLIEIDTKLRAITIEMVQLMEIDEGDKKNDNNESNDDFKIER